MGINLNLYELLVVMRIKMMKKLKLVEIIAFNSSELRF
jgi:hypothetical protein